LQKIKETYPKIIRVVLSGYSDKEQLIRTVSDGVVRAYLYKPWDNDELVAYVDSCFKIVDDTAPARVERAISEFGLELPRFSQDFQDFQNLFKDSCDPKDLIRSIQANSDYTRSLLETVNTPVFSQSFEDVGDAVNYLGVNVTKDIILHSEVIRSIKKLAPDDFGKELCEFDHHSAVINKVFHDIYEVVTGTPVPDEYKVVTVQHDIGRLMLFCCLRGDCPVIGQDDDECQLVDIERELLSIDHCMMGAYLCQYWSLPLVMQEICLYHHSFSESCEQHRMLIAMISLSDAVAGYVVDQNMLRTMDTELAFLELTTEDIDTLMKVNDWDRIAR